MPVEKMELRMRDAATPAGEMQARGLQHRGGVALQCRRRAGHEALGQARGARAADQRGVELDQWWSRERRQSIEGVDVEPILADPKLQA
mgnify:CR=1 FL=1